MLLSGLRSLCIELLVNRHYDAVGCQTLAHLEMPNRLRQKKRADAKLRLRKVRRQKLVPTGLDDHLQLGNMIQHS